MRDGVILSALLHAATALVLLQGDMSCVLNNNPSFDYDSTDTDAARDGSRDGDGGGNWLTKCGYDLTARARAGKIDPIVGREEEVEMCVEILCRRTKNNPVLVGQPGRQQGRC
jgi:ATP-dependent Clp protease ATP-binding subunit ClpA